MKLNNKGFMLAEVVVVSVVLATVLVTLFSGLMNVSSAYETRNRYYDVDSLYAAMDINDILIKNESSLIYSTSAVELAKDGDVGVYENFYEKTNYSIDSYIIPYDVNVLDSLKNLNDNVTFSEYLDYLSGNIDFNDNYDYIVIIEREKIKNNSDEEDDCYYYALKLKY